MRVLVFNPGERSFAQEAAATASCRALQGPLARDLQVGLAGAGRDRAWPWLLLLLLAPAPMCPAVACPERAPGPLRACSCAAPSWRLTGCPPCESCWTTPATG